MSNLFPRKVNLTVATAGGDGLDLSDAHLRFTVEQNSTESPGRVQIRVYNLSSGKSGDTANVIQKEFSRVILQAGYEGGDSYGTIFDGTIVQTRIGREDPTDTYLDILAADGDEAYAFAVANNAIGAGSTFDDRFSQLSNVLKDHGVDPGYKSKFPSGSLPRGRVYFGPVRDHLRDFSTGIEARWSIQSGKLNIVSNTSYLPGEAVVLTSKTGMLGLPEQQADGIHIKCLLNPRLKVDSRVQVDNKSIQRAKINIQYTAYNFFPNVELDGFYRILAIDHEGDTRGDTWESRLLCVGVNEATTPDAAVKGYG